MARTLPHLQMKAGQRTLDSGCGIGQLLDVLSRRSPGATLVGVWVAAATSPAQASGLPSPQGTFHLIVSTSVLHRPRGPLASIFEAGRRSGDRLARWWSRTGAATTSACECWIGCSTASIPRTARLTGGMAHCPHRSRLHRRGGHGAWDGLVLGNAGGERRSADRVSSQRPSVVHGDYKRSPARTGTDHWFSTGASGHDH